MKGVDKMEINNVLMWHFFDLQMFYVPRVLHPGKNCRKLKNFEEPDPLVNTFLRRLYIASNHERRRGS